MSKNNFLENPYIDITINRHGGNAQSNAANKKLAPYKVNWRERILGLMAIRDEQGLGTSSRHAADYFEREAGQIAGRFTELRVLGIIEGTNVTENDYMVYRLTGSASVKMNEPTVKKHLIVTGNGLCAEAVLEKRTGVWHIVTITPNLKTIIGETPVAGIGDLLKELGFTYSWVKES